MLTRLKVNGFKNLVNVDVRFGPFTCIAGANGVGKSNLFDSIMFLSALATKPLLDAAKSVRDEEGRTSDVRSLFHRVGDDYAKEMSFEVEMIVPQTGIDDLGQEGKASITFLRYLLRLGYRENREQKSQEGLEILQEELKHINRGDANKNLLFKTSLTWRASAISGERRGGPFISTEGEGKERIIKLHQDGGSSGKPRSILATNLPRTVLSSTNAAESPTVLVAKREMQSWQLLQLEPAALRKPDEFSAPTKLGANGAHLASTLHHLPEIRKSGAQKDALGIYAHVANRLADLIDDVNSISVDSDEKRELLTVEVTGRDGTPHSARSLSDGTLRFLALAVLEMDPEATGIICLEEPENGIHPERIPAMLELLQDIAMDVDEPVGSDNPLRQVIINTHSPSVVAQIPDDSLLIAEPIETLLLGKRCKVVRFSTLPENWRLAAQEGVHAVARGKLLSYLNPVPHEETGYGYGKNGGHQPAQKKSRRVIDRPDLQLSLPLVAEKP